MFPHKSSTSDGSDLLSVRSVESEQEHRTRFVIYLHNMHLSCLEVHREEGLL